MRNPVGFVLACRLRCTLSCDALLSHPVRFCHDPAREQNESERKNARTREVRTAPRARGPAGGCGARAPSRLPAFRGADGPRPRRGLPALQSCPTAHAPTRDPDSETRESVRWRSKPLKCGLFGICDFAFLRCASQHGSHRTQSYVYKIRLKEQLRGYDLLQHLLSVTVVFATTP